MVHEARLHTVSVLWVLEQIETRMAQLYEWYGSVFCDDEEASALFLRMAREEVQHQDVVLFQKRLLSSDPDCAESVSVEMDPLRAVLASVEAHMSGPSPSLEEAVAFGLAMEKSAAEQHRRSVFQGPNDDGISRLVSSLYAGDRDHVERLELFARQRFGRAPGTGT